MYERIFFCTLSSRIDPMKNGADEINKCERYSLCELQMANENLFGA